MRTFRQGCCSSTLRVKSNILRRNVIFEKFLLPRTIFLNFEPKICGLSSEKCRKFCQKCLRCMDNNNDSRIIFRSIIWLYLYSDFERKVFDFPRKIFVRVVATAVEAARGTFGEKVWFLKIRVFFKHFLNFEPKDCWILSQIFNGRLC